MQKLLTVLFYLSIGFSCNLAATECHNSKEKWVVDTGDRSSVPFYRGVILDPQHLLKLQDDEIDYDSKIKLCGWAKRAIKNKAVLQLFEKKSEKIRNYIVVKL